ncbi:MAG: SDR family oxidoreductase [Rhodothermales bacterium]
MAYLLDTTVLITGASSGIGAACARRLAADGARLLLCARRLELVESLVTSLRTDHGAEAFAFRLDVRSAEDVEKSMASLPDEWRDIDVLINNAGLARGLAPVYEAAVEEIDDMVDTNVKGLLYVTRCIVPGMIERNRGHVVNIGSTAGHEVYPGGTVYCATKHAVGAISRGLKMDLHGTPIRVSSVDPGMVESDFSLVRFNGDQGRASSVYADVQPLTPEDVAEAVFVCLSQPAHVNFSNLILMPVAQSSATMIHREKQPE